MMTMYAAAVLVGVAISPPDLSGTWKLDPSRSRVTPAAALTGLIGAGMPETLHISQPESGSLVIESQINESHSRIYTPGGKSSTPVFVGGVGTVSMTTRWDGSALVSEGRRESPSGTSTLVIELREVLRLGADGRTLEIEVTASGAEGKSVSQGWYTRTEDVGLCHSWPTPCKWPSR